RLAGVQFENGRLLKLQPVNQINQIGWSTDSHSITQGAAQNGTRLEQGINHGLKSDTATRNVKVVSPGSRRSADGNHGGWPSWSPASLASRHLPGIGGAKPARRFSSAA